MKPIVNIQFMGMAGFGVNSPFGGHDRWTGSKVYKNFCKFKDCIGIGTDEYMTSQTCDGCGSQLDTAKRSYFQDGVRKSKPSNGTKICHNHSCPSFSTHARDPCSCTLYNNC